MQGRRLRIKSNIKEIDANLNISVSLQNQAILIIKYITSFQPEDLNDFLKRLSKRVTTGN